MSYDSRFTKGLAPYPKTFKRADVDDVVVSLTRARTARNARERTRTHVSDRYDDGNHGDALDDSRRGRDDEEDDDGIRIIHSTSGVDDA